MRRKRFRHRVNRPRRKGAKLDIEKVREIRQLYHGEGLKNIGVLAKTFKVSTQTINLVVKNKIWKDSGDDGDELKIGVCSARLIRLRASYGERPERLMKDFRITATTLELVLSEKILREAVQRKRP